MFELILIALFGLTSVSLLDVFSNSDSEDASGYKNSKDRESDEDSNASSSEDEIIQRGNENDSIDDDVENDNWIVDGQAIQGTADEDFLFGGLGSDTIEGLEDSDVVSGGIGNDFLFGGAGNDFVDGGDGDDAILGDEGEDFLVGGMGFDTLYGNQGNDTIISGSRNYFLSKGLPSDGDMSTSFNFGDPLDASNLEKIVSITDFGGEVVFGGNGNDLILMNTGSVVEGGLGEDKFVVLDVSSDVSTIKDFNPDDDKLVIYFSKTIASIDEVRFGSDESGAQYIFVNSELVCRVFSDFPLTQEMISLRSLY